MLAYAGGLHPSHAVTGISFPLLGASIQAGLPRNEHQAVCINKHLFLQALFVAFSDIEICPHLRTGGCDLGHQVQPYYISDPSGVCSGPTTPNLPAPGASYMCSGNILHSGPMWLGAAGFVIMWILMARGINGGVIYGILFATVISWIPSHSASYLGSTSQLEGGSGKECGSLLLLSSQVTVAGPETSRMLHLAAMSSCKLSSVRAA